MAQDVSTARMAALVLLGPGGLCRIANLRPNAYRPWRPLAILAARREVVGGGRRAGSQQRV